MTKILTSIIFSIFFAFAIFGSIKSAKISPTADFAAFYCAGRIVLDPTISNDAVYDQEKMGTVGLKYDIKRRPALYLYSIAATYIFLPFTLFPYGISKIVFNVFNVIIYLSAVAIALRLGGTSGARFIGLMALLLVWAPFFYNQYWLQSNTIVLFVVALGVLLAVRNRPILSGVSFGVATLIKIFPFAIAMILGIKNWRIFAACTAALIASFLLPGSLGWLSAIRNANHANYSEIYRYITMFGVVWLVLYVVFISGITAVVAYQARYLAYTILASFSIPAALLVSPVVGGYYLVLLAFSIAYFIAISSMLPWLLRAIVFTCFFLINYTVLIYDSYAIGLIFLWAALAWWMNYQVKTGINRN
ncbi:MAG: glycosyltransferase family 87 protein [Thermodesulfobacteriota bacterium]|nr:glycosyltransferase family 87 protein [Thermodesulfobacteriota bacterium]